MNPRSKSDKKWTSLPEELKKQIKDVFTQNFGAKLDKNTQFHVDGRIYPKEILLRVGLHKQGELRYANFEVSLDYKADQNSPENQSQEKIVELIYLAVDASASLVAEYLDNDEEIELPYTWMEYPFNGHKIWLQFSRENPDLEAEANRLLELEQDSILKNAESEKSDDLLDATEEEFDEFVENAEPQIFGNKKKKDDLH